MYETAKFNVSMCLVRDTRNIHCTDGLEGPSAEEQFPDVALHMARIPQMAS